MTTSMGLVMMKPMQNRPDPITRNPCPETAFNFRLDGASSDIGTTSVGDMF